ncbi:PREDICTED: double homeobox protein A-like [Miniopterus natalensis]|uniref:double homeobox protein A-like n=1 Tax=Miniopterus natalensis TaxID=291302 RepID=UPI0007A6BEB3|nr:PREDICTED: double homeobox protein A-like [Miniopterus natalensis]
MAQDGSPKAVNHRRCSTRTKFTKDQLTVLIRAFNQEPYPSYNIRQKLALEMNLEGPIIQTWFQNQRAKHGFQRRPEPEDLAASQAQDQPVKSPRRWRPHTIYTSSRLHTLNTALKNDPYPGVDSREQLAKEVGVPEPRVHVWFQNRRSKFFVQRKKEADEPSEQEQDG